MTRPLNGPAAAPLLIFFMMCTLLASGLIRMRESLFFFLRPCCTRLFLLNWIGPQFNQTVYLFRRWWQSSNGRFADPTGRETARNRHAGQGTNTQQQPRRAAAAAADGLELPAVPEPFRRPGSSGATRRYGAQRQRRGSGTSDAPGGAGQLAQRSHATTAATTR